MKGDKLWEVLMLSYRLRIKLIKICIQEHLASFVEDKIFTKETSWPSLHHGHALSVYYVFIYVSIACSQYFSLPAEAFFPWYSAGVFMESVILWLSISIMVEIKPASTMKSNNCANLKLKQLGALAWVTLAPGVPVPYLLWKYIPSWLKKCPDMSRQ